MSTPKSSQRPAWALFAAIAIISAAVAAPTAVWAAATFTDVPDSNVFKADIDWLADAGVTRGCNPPANDQFCPDDNVTRAQMAAFMHRLATNQVVDADKVDGSDAADLETSAFSVWDDGPIQIANPDSTVFETIITLPLDPGSYVIIAKASFLGISNNDVDVTCRLQADANFDQVKFDFPEINSQRNVSAALTVVNTFNAAGEAVFKCKDNIPFNVNLWVEDAKITAIQVDHLSNNHS